MKKLVERLHHLTSRNYILLAILFFYLCGKYSYRLRDFYKVFVLLPCGLGALFYMFAKRRIVFDRFTALLIAICGFLTLATLLNRVHAAQSLIRLATYYVFILFAAITPKNAEPRALRKETMSFATELVVLLFPFALLGLVSVFIGRPISLPLANNAIGITQEGLINDRIFLPQNPNVAARGLLSGIFLSIYMLYQHPPKFARGMLFIAIFVFILFISHTQSRTETYALSVGMGALAFHHTYLKLRGRKGRTIVALLAWIVTAAATVLLVLSLFTLDIQIACRTSTVPVIGDLGMSRFITSGPLNVTENGRGEIWKAGIQYLRRHPLYLTFGMGSGDIMKRIAAEHSTELASLAHLHNSFLEVLARGGIFCLISILIMLGMLVRPCVRLLTSSEVDGDRGCYVLAVILGVFIINSFAEAPIFTTEHFTNLLFFFAAGHIMRLNREGKLSRGVDDPARK